MDFDTRVRQRLAGGVSNFPKDDRRQRGVGGEGVSHEFAVMRAGRGVAPRIRGIVEVPKSDQTFLTSGQPAAHVLANLFRRARRPPKSDLVHLAAEKIELS